MTTINILHVQGMNNDIKLFFHQFLPEWERGRFEALIAVNGDQDALHRSRQDSRSFTLALATAYLSGLLRIPILLR